MAKLDFKSMNLQDIINWCKENNQVEWLKAKAQETVVVERYTGRVATTNAKGKTVFVADKNSQKVKERKPITFIQIKTDFVNKFMPEIAPKKKAKEKNMYDIIAEL